MSGLVGLGMVGSLLGLRSTPSFITKGINNEAQQIAGKVIGGVGAKAERGATQFAHSKVDQYLPTFAKESVEGFIDKGIHKAVSKGEQLATREASKIHLV